MGELRVVDEGDREFRRVSEMARAALALAERHRTPPTPRILEIWTAYLTSADQRLRQLIDAELAERAGIDADTLSGIYADHMETNQTATTLSKAGRMLATAAAEMGALIDSTAALVAGHDRQLAEAHVALREARTVEETRERVAELKHRNRAIHDEVRGLSRHFAITRESVADIRMELESARQVAFIDHLTQIPNRRGFDDALSTEVARRRKQGAPVSLLVLDLDTFSSFNEAYGHSAGDGVLRVVARLVTRNVKGRDTAARVGGDAIGVILPDTPLRGARRLAEQLQTSVSETLLVNGETGAPLGAVTTTIGVAMLRDDETSSSLFRRASQLCARGGREGGDQVVCEV